MQKEEITQAVVIADVFNNNLNPITSDRPLALVPVVGVPLVNFVLDSLAQSGVDETILFVSQHAKLLKDYISRCKEDKVTWSLCMEVQVLSSETCRTMGDVMRELDAISVIRGHFILAGINSIFNVQLMPLFEQHKQIFKKDKGATMCLLYKKSSYGHQLLASEAPTFVATDSKTKRILIHQKFKSSNRGKTLSLPLEIILNHPEMDLHYDLIDANIAFCSPSVLPLFSDNFDFQTRDDFIKGILMNEEILASSLYYFRLSNNDYASCISNWQSYRIISRDILHHWVFPRTKEIWHIKNKSKFIFGGNHVYRNTTATLSRKCVLEEDVVIDEETKIDDCTFITKSFIGSNCTIGKNVKISNCHILSNVIIENDCILSDAFIGENCTINNNVILAEGTLLSPNVKVKANTEIKGQTVLSDSSHREILKSTSDSSGWDNESSNSDDDEICVGFNQIHIEDESYYSSDSSEDFSLAGSPIPEDSNIFLNEVIDSLARGYEEKLNCDYLILEINSSRYAYNMQLHEVNFYFVKALLSMPMLESAKNVLAAVKDIFKYFKPIIVNYIKTDEAVHDCLKAVEESCIEHQWLHGKSGQILHLLYNEDIAEESQLMDWFEELNEKQSGLLKQASLTKFFEWLQQESEDSDKSS